jgi:hypothetical protein
VALADVEQRFLWLPIARIDLPASGAAAIPAAEGEAADAGITCLHGELDPGRAEAIDLVQRPGYRLIEVALDLEEVDQPRTTLGLCETPSAWMRPSWSSRGSIQVLCVITIATVSNRRSRPTSASDPAGTCRGATGAVSSSSARGNFCP